MKILKIIYELPMSKLLILYDIKISDIHNKRLL
jgi:hypothetical protein